MRITRVHIENYRSIKKLDWYPTDYCVLIGENNAGKSNILKALNLVLGENWPTDRTFTLDDYYRHSSDDDIVIQVYLDTPLETWKNMSLQVSGFELRGHAYKRAHRGMPRGTLTVDYHCINEKGETIRYPAEPLHEGIQAKYWFDLKVPRDLRDQLPCLYIDTRRDYNRYDPSHRWTALHKMITDIGTEISHDRATVKVATPAGEVKMTRREAFEHKLQEAYSYLRNPDFIGLEDKIDSHLKQLGFGRDRSDGAVHMVTQHPVDIFRHLQLLVDQGGVPDSIETAGAGMQSAVIIAILRAYQEIKKAGAVLAIEGPELFLHPHKVRSLAQALRAASASHQVFITTHSPEFIDIARPEEICLVRHNTAEGTDLITCPPEGISASDKEELGRLNFMDAHRNEMFFARGLILAAGPAEQQAARLAALRQGIDLNQAGIEVIECGEPEKLQLLTRLADAFTIPWVVINGTGPGARVPVPSPVTVDEAIQKIYSIMGK